MMFTLIVRTYWPHPAGGMHPGHYYGITKGTK